MPDLKSFAKKFERKEPERIEKIVEVEKEVRENKIEAAPENIVEVSEPGKAVEPEEQKGTTEMTAGFVVGQGILQKRKEREEQIERILAKDMEEIFEGMPEMKQKEFKQQGEKTAKEISLMLEKTRVKIKKVINLIKKWLSVIPGVNKFFLEQESKIKTDEIMKIKTEHK